MEYQRILVATDFHDDHEPVLLKAKQLQLMFNAELTVVCVTPKLPYYMASGLSSISDIEEQIEIDGRSVIQEAVKKHDINAKFELRHGSAKLEISNLAIELQADLIVIGSHGKHGRQLLLGSTSSGVLHRAHCDVMVVRTNKKPKDKSRPSRAKRKA